jgi:peptide/nickel transport system substrate-binding protein
MRKHLQFLLALLLLSSVVAACVAPAAAPQTAAAEPAGAATRTQLLVAEGVAPDMLDLQQGYGGDRISTEQIGQPLVRMDSATGQLVPDLAESWQFSADGKTLTIKLPAGAVYANGAPLNAQALKDAWTRYKTISPFAIDLEALTEMNVVDETTLEAIFAAPPAASLVALTTAFLAPWDAAEADNVGNETFANAPVASGPFAVKEFIPGSELSLVRNDSYQTRLPFVKNQGPLHLTEVHVRYIPEPATIASELEAGTVDLVTNLPPSAVDRFRSNPDIQLYEVNQPGYRGLLMNLSRPQFADIKVRQAIAKAVNREEIVKALGSTAAPIYAFINAAMVAYSAETESYAQTLHPQDVDAAKGLLSEAGWADSDNDGIVEKEGAPFAVEFLIPSNNEAQKLASQVLQAQLKTIGIAIQIKELDAKAAREELSAGNFDLSFENVAWPDPDILSLVFGAPYWNFGRYENPAQIEKLNGARYLLDPAERTAAYAEIQKVWLDDVVQIPLWQNKRYAATRTWVKGLIVDATGAFYLNDVTIEEQ